MCRHPVAAVILVCAVGGSSSAALAQIPMQQGDWPKPFGYYVEPITCDADGDGALELIVNEAYGITIYRHDGSIYGTIPMPPGPVYVREVIAAGDLQGDGIVDIVAVVSGTQSQLNANNLLAIWTVDGDCPFASCSLPFEPRVAWTHAGPTLSDLDNDGDLEIIITWALPEYYLGILVLEVGAGSIERRWRHLIDAGGTLNTVTDAAVGDIDGDGAPEIIFGSTGSWLEDGGFLYAFHDNGMPVENWPIELDEGVTHPPVLADLDGDDGLEIIINGYGLHDPAAGLKVWNYRAELLWAGVGRGRTPVVADITGDGVPEVLTQARAYFHDGTWTGWSYGVGNPNGLSVADIDSDGDMELLLGASGSEGLVAFHHNGAPVAGFPLFVDPEFRHTFMTPVLADLDGDGDIEVTVTGAFMAVWDLPGAYDPCGVQWPMYKHDPQRVGIYEQTPGCLRADLNGDGVVGTPDLELLLAAWGTDRPRAADIDGDATVDALDVCALVARWGAR